MSDDTKPCGVWAPTASAMNVVLDAHDGRGRVSVPMEQDENNWWWAQVPVVEAGPAAGEANQGAGLRYGFSLDGADPLPDPRSLSQPDGVHGLSEAVDLDAFTWSDQGWQGSGLHVAVIYEMHLGTFTPEGTFDAAIGRLDHLADLGVTMVEVMPVASFPGHRNWGYDGVNLGAVHAPYGGPRGLQRFVDAAHQHGLAVCLDVVYNHLGPSGNYLARFGPYFTGAYHTPWGLAVNLDMDSSDEVRSFILDNARTWMEGFHVDALRLDAVHELHDRRAIPLLEELSAMADEISGRTGVERTLIAESDRNDPRTVTRRAPAGAGGLGLHGQWVDDVHHSLHAQLTGESQGYYGDFTEPGALVKTLGHSPFLHDGTYSTFRGQVHGRPVDLEQTPPWRYVASLQTHDQVGNRAVGERLVELAGFDRAAVGAALLLTAPWTPMLFMGEEWGASTPWQYFTDHAEPELAQAIRDGRAREFAEHGWKGDVPDPQDEATRARSRLDWDEAGREPHTSMLAWYRTLLQLRRSRPEITQPPVGSEAAEFVDVDLLRVDRGGVLVYANLAQTEHQVGRPVGAEVLAHWGAVEVTGDQIALPPASVVIASSVVAQGQR